jgi:hypothetical protein
LFLIVLCCAWGHTEATAQARRRGSATNLSAGVRAGRDFENHAWSLGAQAGLQIQDRLEVRPSGDYFFGDRTPFRWQLNADVVQSFGPDRRVYGGGGAAFTRVRALSSVKIGYNLFFGIAPSEPGARRKLFAELRWTFVNKTSPFRLVLGMSQSL